MTMETTNSSNGIVAAEVENSARAENSILKSAPKVLYVDRKDESIQKILKATFSNYVGKHISVEITDKICFWGTQWDSGHKREYKILHLPTFKVVSIGEAPFLRHSSLHEDTFSIPRDYLVACHVYSGAREYLEIHSPSNNLTALLSQPQVELSYCEKRVLYCVKCYKSAYSGDMQYRRTMSGLSKTDYEQAKLNLMEMKLLDKRGAITTAGKNVFNELNLRSEFLR